MDLNIKNIKGIARENLIGWYGLTIGSSLIVTIIISICMSPFQRMLMQGLQQGFQSMVQPIIACAGFFIIALVSLLFAAGINKIHMNIARQKETSINDLLFAFKNRPDRFLGLGVVLVVISYICILPGMLCMTIFSVSGTASLGAGFFVGCILEIIGCIVLIILMLGLSLSDYLLLDDPHGTTVGVAIKKSWQMMKGYKRKLFLLGLSFIGWIILGIVSFGLAMLWITQYTSQATVIFYLKLLAKENAEAFAVVSSESEEQTF